MVVGAGSYLTMVESTLHRHGVMIAFGARHCRSNWTPEGHQYRKQNKHPDSKGLHRARLSDRGSRRLQQECLPWCIAMRLIWRLGVLGERASWDCGGWSVRSIARQRIQD